MKIDKHNPQHWIALILSGCLLLFVLPLRIFRTRTNSGKPTVVFYGHTLNGNLLTLYNHWTSKGFANCFFLSFDTQEKTAQVRAEGFQVLDGLSIGDLYRLVKADALVSSHGIHHFVLLRALTSIKFVDVFHAPLAYKGFDADDFKHLHGHDQVWVSSEKVRQIYINKYGFHPEKVTVTGCARVEDIKKYKRSTKKIKQKYGLSTDKKTVLIAPTWKQDSSNRSIIPFGLTIEEFMISVLSVAKKNDVQIIFRAHLNSGEVRKIERLENVYMMPYSSYPITEEFLAISDVLINDWSSIAIDYLTTNNPVVYLGVEAPFVKGFSAGPEHRFGAIVASSYELEDALREAVYAPKEYQQKYAKSIEDTKDLAFGETLDGQTLDRCSKALTNLLR